MSNSSQGWGGIPLTDTKDEIAQTIIASSYGLLQILYTTAVERGYKENGVGKDPALLLDPQINLEFGTRYLIECINKVNEAQLVYINPKASIKDFSNYIGKGMAGYNRGPADPESKFLNFNERYSDLVFAKTQMFPIYFSFKLFRNAE